MLRMKRGAMIASIIAIGAILLTACRQPFSTPVSVTSTAIDTSNLFETLGTPVASPTGLGGVQQATTQTAQGIDPNLLNTVTPGGAPATASLTPFVQLPSNPTATPTTTLALPSGPTNTPQPQVPPGSRPPTYALKSEEFPFCIARRYGIDPTALLAASNLSSPDIYYAGLVLSIPSGPAWSEADLGPRSLRAHPGSYVVTGNADTTVYGVACKFGDLTPEAIVAANGGLSLNSTLTVGQSLNIP